jgi:hypothetical protein
MVITITWGEKGGQRASKEHYFDPRRHIPGIFRTIFVSSLSNFDKKLLLSAPVACFPPFDRYKRVRVGPNGKCLVLFHGAGAIIFPQGVMTSGNIFGRVA